MRAVFGACVSSPDWLAMAKIEIYLALGAKILSGCRLAAGPGNRAFIVRSAVHAAGHRRREQL